MDYIMTQTSGCELGWLDMRWAFRSRNFYTQLRAMKYMAVDPHFCFYTGIEQQNSTQN